MLVRSGFCVVERTVHICKQFTITRNFWTDTSKTIFKIISKNSCVSMNKLYQESREKGVSEDSVIPILTKLKQNHYIQTIHEEFDIKLMVSPNKNVPQVDDNQAWENWWKQPVPVKPNREADITPSHYTPQQTAILDIIKKTRKGDIRGPFLVWINNPEIANRAQNLGEYLRYHTSLPERLSELAIMTVARYYNCEREWFIHKPIAINSGVDSKVLDAIIEKKTPQFQQQDDRVVYNFTYELVTSKFISETVYQEAAKVIGMKSMIELNVLIGYYVLVAFTLNTFYPGVITPDK